MKTKILKITPQQLVEILQGKADQVTANLPNDTELLEAKVDLLSKQVILLLQSSKFENTSDTTPTPEINSVPFVLETKEKPPLTTVTVKTLEPKIVDLKPESSPAVAKAAQPPASRYAAKMENEFSPDQRKLLSFTVTDDCVIVKPVVFLKTEWDDINEVVRGIGGRWVKGDIISYWEIPL